MIRVHIYPVMDGIELEVAGVCVAQGLEHGGHRGGSTFAYIKGEDIAERGLQGALAHEITIMFHEYSELLERARC